MTQQPDGPVPSDKEVAEARALISEFDRTMRWNPWIVKERGAAYSAAHDVLARHAPPDPDEREMSPEEIQAEVDRREADFNARMEENFARQQREEEQQRRDQAERAQHYDERRSLARLALLEQHGMRRSAVRERESIFEYGPVSNEPQDARRVWLNRAEREIAEAEKWIKNLEPVVGDAETVIDEHGWLPSERREAFFREFAHDREHEVMKLRDRRRDLKAELMTAEGLERRAELREQLKRSVKRLEHLEAIPPLTPSDMCSECPWPEDWHEIGTTLSFEMDGYLRQPCASWPGWNETRRFCREKAKQLLEEWNNPKSSVSAPPKPERLAVIPAGTPIAEVIAQLTAIQEERPEAEMRSGKRGTFEVWTIPSSP